MVVLSTKDFEIIYSVGNVLPAMGTVSRLVCLGDAVDVAVSEYVLQRILDILPV